MPDVGMVTEKMQLLAIWGFYIATYVGMVMWDGGTCLWGPWGGGSYLYIPFLVCLLFLPLPSLHPASDFLGNLFCFTCQYY